VLPDCIEITRVALAYSRYESSIRVARVPFQLDYSPDVG